ncbi:hypothetical protein BGY98DRAFT_1097178 [Russula aff. rugulosa BPL654]|nr:hypothetical protein BGY98DRAFT_1097178 [Russula aff. rugulosa BPL654]
MPSKSLITSWTTSFVPSGTRFSHSRRKAYPYAGNSFLPSPRRRVLKHLHVLWKGTPSSRKRQSASDPMLCLVSSTISVPGVPGETLVSRPSPTPSSPIFSPPSPTTPASLPSDVDTDSNAIKFSEVEPRDILFESFDDLSLALLPFSGAPAEPTCALEPSSYYRQPVSQSQSLPGYSPLHSRTSTSLAVAGCSTSGYTLNAATRLQDFRALIDELRTTLLHHDSKEESMPGIAPRRRRRRRRGERLLRLLEDVMQKVQQLAKNDPPPPWRSWPSVTMTAAAP